MLHHEAEAGSNCPGLIKRRWYRTRFGEWRPRISFKCAVCGLHFHRNLAGELVPGMNLLSHRGDKELRDAEERRDEQTGGGSDQLS
jgi:hypothetical protein